MQRVGVIVPVHWYPYLEFECFSSERQLLLLRVEGFPLVDVIEEILGRHLEDTEAVPGLLTHVHQAIMVVTHIGLLLGKLQTTKKIHYVLSLLSPFCGGSPRIGPITAVGPVQFPSEEALFKVHGPQVMEVVVFFGFSSRARR